MSLITLETRLLTRSRGLIALWIGFALLLAYALATGLATQARWQQAVDAQRAATEETYATELARIASAAPDASGLPAGAPPARQRMDATLPPAPGLLIALGDTGARPVIASVRYATRADTLFKNVEVGNGVTRALGALDFTFWLVVLMPLLVIAFTHDVVAGERDAQRLHLVQAQAGALRGVVLRRLIVRLAPGLVLVVLGFASAIVLGLPASLAACAALIAALYLLGWGAVCAWVSHRAATAQAAAAWLLVGWLLVVIVIPAATALAVQTLAPVPSRSEQVLAVRQVQLALQPRATELLGQYLTDHPELAKGGSAGFAQKNFVMQRETEARLAPVFAQFEQAQLKQERAAAMLQWLSPAALTQRALVRLAGTDSIRYRAYLTQVNAFSEGWRTTLREPVFAGRNLTADELKALPRFRFVEP